MIQLKTITTTRGFAKDDDWLNHGELYPAERPSFPTLQRAKEYLKEKYGNCKRVPLRLDSKKHGEGIHVGWVYSFRDVEHHRDGKTYHFIQQDWVHFYSTNNICPTTGHVFNGV